MIGALIVVALIVAFVALFILAAASQTRDWTPEQWAHAHANNDKAAAWNSRYNG